MNERIKKWNNLQKNQLSQSGEYTRRNIAEVILRGFPKEDKT